MQCSVDDYLVRRHMQGAHLKDVAAGRVAKGLERDALAGTGT